MARIWTQPLQWQNEGIEPSAELKQAGFIGGYRPVADNFNYFLHKEKVCIEELQAAVDDVGFVLEGFDCGYFEGDVTPLIMHKTSSSTHKNLNVDGNVTGLSETGDTLEEHEVDPQAHKNLNVDGNITL